MAEALGTRLLAGVEEVPLDRILLRVKRLCKAAVTQHSEEHGESENTETPYPHLQVPWLDHLISILTPWSNTAELPVVEINTAESGNGATHVTYLAIAGAVLPQKPPHNSHGNWNGGKGGLAIVLDPDGRFEAERLAQVMTSLLFQSGKHHLGDVELTVRTALDHVHLFQPESLVALVATLEALPMYLRGLTESSHPFNASATRALELVVIDSVSAFYWQHRNAEEQARANEDMEELAYLQSLWQRLAGALRELQAHFGVPLVATAWPAHTAGRAPATVSKSQLPPTWQQLVTARIHVRRDAGALRPETESRCQWFHAWAVDERAVARGTAWHFGIGNAGIRCNDNGREMISNIERRK